MREKWMIFGYALKANSKARSHLAPGLEIPDVPSHAREAGRNIFGLVERYGTTVALGRKAASSR